MELTKWAEKQHAIIKDKGDKEIVLVKCDDLKIPKL